MACLPQGLHGTSAFRLEAYTSNFAHDICIAVLSLQSSLFAALYYVKL